jgi:hypothetical protein
MSGNLRNITKGIVSRDRIRCPACEHIADADEFLYNGVSSIIVMNYQGKPQTEEAHCLKCDHDFEVIVTFVHTFFSPELHTKE